MFAHELTRSVSLASKGQLPRPEGLSESWWDFAVLLEFFEPTEAMGWAIRPDCHSTSSAPYLNDT